MNSIERIDCASCRVLRISFDIILVKYTRNA